jgi:PAS domain S-box-containing protein
MFGISADATVSMDDFYACLHPEDRERVSLAFAAAVDARTRALYDVEYRTVGKEDGLVRWVAAKGRGRFDAEGRCVRVIGTAIDVTARKQIEHALQESEARLRALTDNLPSGMIYQLSTGADGTDRRFLYVSQSHERLTGVPAEAVFADPTLPYSLILEEDREGLAAAEMRAIQSLGPFDAEARIRRADGEIRWTRIISAPRRQPDGSIIWDGIQVDVTEQKKALADLRELNESLEQHILTEVEKRVRVEEALRQAQKLEAMGQLTGGVAHDFNNLLTPIIGSLDMLVRRGVGSERERKLIDGALQSAERAKTLVQRLLAFARRQPLQPTAVDVGSVIQGMADLVASTTGPQIKVSVEIDDDLPLARADLNQLEMALLNLSVNARDAMPDGGTLRISATPDALAEDNILALRPGRYVRISVADTGTGMDDETRARAIEPFFSTKGVGRGTGLGLSMVHGLASQLDGALSIQSRVGLGTNVQLWLPVSAERRTALSPAARNSQSVTISGTVLLVDDEALVRASTAHMLNELGYAVHEVGSTEKALALLREGLRPDLVVTDHLMPGMTGTDLAARIRESWPQTPILLVSGYAEVESLSPDLPRLTKPFRISDLAESIGALRRAAGA